SKSETSSTSPSACHIFLTGSVATQKRNGKYQDENKQTQQPKLGHARSKYARPLGRPRSAFCEGGRFQGNHQHAPDGSNQADYEERFRYQNMRVNGDANRMQNLHQHQNYQQLVQHLQRLGGDRPMREAIPKHLAGVGNGRERGDKKQNGKHGIDHHFGVAQIVAKVGAELLFGHLGSLVESIDSPLRRQSMPSIAEARLTEK